MSRMCKFAIKKSKSFLGEDPQTPLDRFTVMSSLYLYTSCIKFVTQGDPPPQSGPTDLVATAYG